MKWRSMSQSKWWDSDEVIDDVGGCKAPLWRWVLKGVPWQVPSFRRKTALFCFYSPSTFPHGTELVLTRFQLTTLDSLLDSSRCNCILFILIVFLAEHGVDGGDFSSVMDRPGAGGKIKVVRLVETMDLDHFSHKYKMTLRAIESSSWSSTFNLQPILPSPDVDHQISSTCCLFPYTILNPHCTHPPQCLCTLIEQQCALHS